MNLFNRNQPKKDEEGNDIPTVTNVLAKTVKDYVAPIEECQALILKCPKCDNIHFRHAGYVETVLPYVEAGGQSRVVNESHAVKVCTKCKHSYVSIGQEHMYDITSKIDLEAWEKAEKELHKATGHGGQC